MKIRHHTDLMQAIKDDDLTSLKNLVSTEDIEEKNNLNETAIFVAICHENTEAVKILLESGANPLPEPSDFSGWSTTTFASAFFLNDILELLLLAGADPNISDGKGGTPLFWGKRLITSHKIESIHELLIKYGAS